ncbi:MAG: hypothetical protein AABZ06_05100 [Bdellovibrionota bacterium]
MNRETFMLVIGVFAISSLSIPVLDTVNAAEKHVTETHTIKVPHPNKSDEMVDVKVWYKYEPSKKNKGKGTYTVGINPPGVSSVKVEIKGDAGELKFDQVTAEVNKRMDVNKNYWHSDSSGRETLTNKGRMGYFLERLNGDDSDNKIILDNFNGSVKEKYINLPRNEKVIQESQAGTSIKNENTKRVIAVYNDQIAKNKRDISVLNEAIDHVCMKLAADRDLCNKWKNEKASLEQKNEALQDSLNKVTDLASTDADVDSAAQRNIAAANNELSKSKAKDSYMAEKVDTNNITCCPDSAKGLDCNDSDIATEMPLWGKIRLFQFNFAASEVCKGIDKFCFTNNAKCIYLDKKDGFSIPFTATVACGLSKGEGKKKGACESNVTLCIKKSGALHEGGLLREEFTTPSLSGVHKTGDAEPAAGAAK